MDTGLRRYDDFFVLYTASQSRTQFPSGGGVAAGRGGLENSQRVVVGSLHSHCIVPIPAYAGMTISSAPSGAPHCSLLSTLCSLCRSVSEDAIKTGRRPVFYCFTHDFLSEDIVYPESQARTSHSP